MNILILTGKFGLGHYSASFSLSEQIKNDYPEAEIMIVDMLEYTVPSCSNVIYDFYSLLVNRGSKLYNAIYKYSERSKVELKIPLMSYLVLKLDRLINVNNPDIIISTLPLCTQLVSRYKNLYNNDIPLVTCITDLCCHPEWLATGTDIYFVANQVVKNILIGQGIPEGIIYIIGIPVKPQFKKHHKFRHAHFRQILIMGGGLGLLPKAASFYQALNDIKNLRTIVITGENEKLYKRIKGKYENIEVIGYTNKVYQYMQNADLVISKPGGITLYETIFSELPIIVFKPYLEQEINNSEFILNHQIGLVLPKNTKDCIDQIAILVNDDEMLNQIRTNMQTLKNEINNIGIGDILYAISSKGKCA